MPASIDWHPTFDHVLVMVLSSDLTMEEVLWVMQQEKEYLEAASQKVITVVDMSGVHSPPKDSMLYMNRVARNATITHPNAGAKIVAGAKGFVATLIRVFSRVHYKLRHADSVAEAEEIIKNLQKPHD